MYHKIKVVMGNRQNIVTIVLASDIKCELWESSRKIMHRICVYENCMLRASDDRQVPNYYYYPTDSLRRFMLAKKCAISRCNTSFIICTCNTHGYNCQTQNICTLIEQEFTYLWEATKSSSFLAPFRFSAPNFTKKDRQCSRSSAGSPWKLQEGSILYEGC